MADIVTKCRTANAVRNGRAIVGVTANGGYDALTPPLEQNIPDLTGIETNLDARFDDKDYYNV